MKHPSEGVRRLDPHQSAKVTDPTIKRCKVARVPVVSYLIENYFNLVFGAELTIFLCLKNTDSPCKPALKGAVAALEHVLRPSELLGLLGCVSLPTSATAFSSVVPGLGV